MNRLSAVLLRIFQSLWANYNLHPILFVASVFILFGSGLVFISSSKTNTITNFATSFINEPKSITIVPIKPNLPEGAQIENGHLVHYCKKGDSILKIAKQYYSYSHIFIRDELKDALIAMNPNLKRSCNENETVVIPEPILEPMNNQPIQYNGAVKAIYLRGENTVPGRLSAEVKRIKRAGANGVVFDVKDILGVVNYKSNIEQVEKYRQHNPPIPDLPKTISYLHLNNIYVIARTAVFQDRNLALVRPDLAIPDTNSPTGKLLFKGEPLWVDPGHPDVQRYNLQIIDELVRLGVDEIQLDYIRYPAEGNLSGVSYYKVENPIDKTEHLKQFLAGAWILTRNTNVKLAIDVFGVVAWGEEKDRNSTGQRLEVFAPYIDVVSPMLYPSHFNKGFDGFEKPADQPIHFYTTGNQKVREMMGPYVVIRPWLQAFKWRVSNYNESYILQQIQGNRAGGGEGWMMWNAGNNYDVVYNALGNRGQLELVESKVVDSKKVN
ncbi:MAG: hypothetical protein H3C43_03390 [Leptonema sp. (in: Bacteria)]|nr:hypothetical protein [Leptonema sp. (in: bacteria)]